MLVPQIPDFVIAALVALAGFYMIWVGYKLTVAQTRLEGLAECPTNLCAFYAPSLLLLVSGVPTLP